MKKSLLETNPYLKDPVKRQKMLLRSIISSSAIEGIYVTEEDLIRYREKLALEDIQKEPSDNDHEDKS